MAAAKKSVLDGIIYFFNVLAAVALLLSYLAYYISPDLTTIFAFFGLAYPVLLLANILMVLYWLFKLKRKIFLSIVCIGIGYFHLGRLYQFNGQKMLLSQDEGIKVMTYNMRHLGHTGSNTGTDNLTEIEKIVAEQNPDILIVQEYNPYKDSKHFGYRYALSKGGGSKITSGPVIFSKFKIIGSGVLPFNHEDKFHNTEFLYADIDVKGKTYRIFNVHFASIGFQGQDYERLAHPEKGNSDEIKRDFKKIYLQLDEAFKSRALQIEAVETAIEDSPYPVILAGDFNDTPQSYTYHRVNLLLEDSFKESGQGFGRTYVNGPIPLRIDYIFHSTELTPYNYTVINKEFSDHYANVVEFK